MSPQRLTFSSLARSSDGRLIRGLTADYATELAEVTGVAAALRASTPLARWCRLEHVDAEQLRADIDATLDSSL